MNLRRVARVALVGPVMITGGMLVLTLGSANVFAASGSSANAPTHSSAASNLPQSSSRKHDHDTVECSPGRVPNKHGQCAVTFADPGAGDNSVGQRVCFSVSPAKAGSVGTGAGHCAFVKNNHPLPRPRRVRSFRPELHCHQPAADGCWASWVWALRW